MIGLAPQLFITWVTPPHTKFSLHLKIMNIYDLTICESSYNIYTFFFGIVSNHGTIKYDIGIIICDVSIIQCDIGTI